HKPNLHSFPTRRSSDLLSDNEFEDEIKTISLKKLYELGKISSGTASKILGIHRVDFIEMIGRYKVSVFQFYDENDLEEDVANAKSEEHTSELQSRENLV